MQRSIQVTTTMVKSRGSPFSDLRRSSFHLQSSRAPCDKLFGELMWKQYLQFFLAMAISEKNWWFLWDKKHSINRVLLVLITGISGHNCEDTDILCSNSLWHNHWGAVGLKDDNRHISNACAAPAWHFQDGTMAQVTLRATLGRRTFMNIHEGIVSTSFLVRDMWRDFAVHHMVEEEQISCRGEVWNQALNTMMLIIYRSPFLRRFPWGFATHYFSFVKIDLFGYFYGQKLNLPLRLMSQIPVLIYIYIYIYIIYIYSI